MAGVIIARDETGRKFNVLSYERFEVFGQVFHVTEIKNKDCFYTVTHAGTGLMLNIEEPHTYKAKERANQNA